MLSRFDYSLLLSVEQDVDARICDELFSLAQTKWQHFTCAPAETGLTSSGGYRCIRAAPPPYWGTTSGDSWEIVAMGIANVLSKTLSKYSIFVTYVSCPKVTTFYLRYLGALDEIMVSAQQPRKNITKIPKSALLCHMKPAATFLILCRSWGSTQHKPKQRHMIMAWTNFPVHCKKKKNWK